MDDGTTSLEASPCAQVTYWPTLRDTTGTPTLRSHTSPKLFQGVFGRFT